MCFRVDQLLCIDENNVLKWLLKKNSNTDSAPLSVLNIIPTVSNISFYVSPHKYLLDTSSLLTFLSWYLYFINCKNGFVLCLYYTYLHSFSEFIWKKKHLGRSKQVFLTCIIMGLYCISISLFLHFQFKAWYFGLYVVLSFRCSFFSNFRLYILLNMCAVTSIDALGNYLSCFQAFRATIIWKSLGT
jgi:hypothetical protein